MTPDLDMLNKFLDEKCLDSKTDLSFVSFHLAFERWLPSNQRHQITRDDLSLLMRGQDRFNLYVDGHKVFVLKCTIPEEQRDMVGS